jgi:two-component system sensor histidine kinase KdpD
MNSMSTACMPSPERTLGLIRSPREAPDHSNDALAGVLLASLGHDLRTRLTVIGGAASNLREARLSADDRCEQSDLILTEVARLNWLLQNILEIGRIDSRATAADRQWADPEDVIIAARRLVEHVLQEHPLNVSAQLDSPVRLDVRVTATALAHLANVPMTQLENAAQYSPASSPIHVIVRRTQDEFVIQVRDHGPGIPQRDLPHLFQRFYRGATAKRIRPGTGLGLWITERLLAVQNGRVWAENCPDGGARFTIAVPTSVRQLACV